MRCLVIAFVFFGLLLSAAAPRLPYAHGAPAIESTPVQAQASDTRLMQQSDYKRRMEGTRKVRSEGSQAATAAVPEASSGNSDYLILLVVAGSVVILAFLPRRKRRAGFRL